jgi:hypothetical protein
MEDVARHEHLAFHSDLDLEPLCEAIRAVLGLPPFEFGSENDTEWGLVVQDGVEYNVSKPYEDGTLQEWDDTVPGWCNVGLTLLVSKQHPRAGDPDWSVVVLVRSVGERLAAGLGGPIAHHRTSTSLPSHDASVRPHLFLTPDNK